jgi:hypothetical protein
VIYTGCCELSDKQVRSQVRFFRLLVWLVFFVVATFCWIVVIEHGPENFAEGARIEIENIVAASR